MSRVLDVADQAAWWLRKHPQFAVPGGLAVVAALVLLAVSSGGGSNTPKVPATAAALVGDAPVANADIDRWSRVYAAGSGATTSAGAAARKAAFAMLVQGAWIEQEAAREHVTVTDAKVSQAEAQYLAQYRSRGTTAQILQQLGLSAAQLAFQLRISLLTGQLQDKVIKAVPSPSADAIRQAYASQPARWAHPSTRDLRLVVTDTQAHAAAAATALKAGTAFGTVAKQYSIDTTLASTGGLIKGLVPGTTTAALENAVFTAKPNTLVGPLKTSGGWIVFEVQKSVPGADQSLQQATAKIEKDLLAASRTAAVTRYVKDLQQRWKARTVCRDAAGNTAVCGNAA